MERIDKVPQINLFLENSVFDEAFLLINESKTKEEYLTEVFSSEHFDLEEINERNQFEEEIYREYRKIRPDLVKGYRSKKLTGKYFKLEEANMERNIEKDRTYVKHIVEQFIEKLQSVNEEGYDINLNALRTMKIEQLKSFRRKSLRKLTAELKEMKIFYANNPKLLII